MRSGTISLSQCEHSCARHMVPTSTRVSATVPRTAPTMTCGLGIRMWDTQSLCGIGMEVRHCQTKDGGNKTDSSRALTAANTCPVTSYQDSIFNYDSPVCSEMTAIDLTSNTMKVMVASPPLDLKKKMYRSIKSHTGSYIFGTHLARTGRLRIYFCICL